MLFGGIFRREFLIENGIFFHEGMIAQEDTLFYYEMSLFTDTILKLILKCIVIGEDQLLL